MARAVLIGAVVTALVVGAYLVGAGSSDEVCGDGEVRIDGGCEELRAGRPVDPESSAESIASFATDEDPAANTLFPHCGFQGIAAERVDVYLCVVDYVGAPITLRLTRERDGPTYRVTLLSDPERQAYATSDPGDDGTVECTLEGSPSCK